MKSGCGVKLFFNEKGLFRVLIVLSGEASAIPSHKNNRLHSRIAPAIEKRLQKITQLYKESVQGAAFHIPGRVFITVVLGERSRRVDSNNALNTVTDLLEPAIKNNKERNGWGIGLIEDDKYSDGVCVHGLDYGLKSDCTFISVESTKTLINPLGAMIGQLLPECCDIQTVQREESLHVY